MKPLLALTIWLATATAIAADDPQEILLWPNWAPGSEGKSAPEKVEVTASGERNITSVHKPSITPYLPTDGAGTGAAVLVIPGGGHRMLCMDHEGANAARLLAEHGVAAFVLKYRLAREPGSTYTIRDHALADAERAIRIIRSRASEWQLDPKKVGALGFSAGGELVALASMRSGERISSAADEIDRQDSRPSFQALIYPGRSGDIQPDKNAPPAFLACSTNDRRDISEGLAEAYLRFKRAGASAELHVYATGGHGFGVRSRNKGAIGGWPDRFLEWLESKQFGMSKRDG
jgi:endo-1,4-beta-xylanase